MRKTVIINDVRYVRRLKVKDCSECAMYYRFRSGQTRSGQFSGQSRCGEFIGEDSDIGKVSACGHYVWKEMPTKNKLTKTI